jgi:Transcriptional regulator PadR-like family
VPVRVEIEARTHRSASRGAIYITLDRLEEKGFLRSHLADGTDERSGRKRRYYRITPRRVFIFGFGSNSQPAFGGPPATSRRSLRELTLRTLR